MSGVGFSTKADRGRLFGWGLVLVGVACLVAGAVQVARAQYLVDQLSFLMSGGLGGLGCLIVGTGLVISNGLYREWSSLNGIEVALRDGARVEFAVVDAADSDTLTITDGALAVSSIGSR